MNQRIYELRTKLNLSQAVFGEKIGLKKSAISKLEKGGNNPTLQTLLLIHYVFNGNISWLKTGEGEMFNVLSPDDEITAACNAIAKNTDPFITNAIIEYMHLNEDNKAVIRNLVAAIGQDLNKEE